MSDIKNTMVNNKHACEAFTGSDKYFQNSTILVKKKIRKKEKDKKMSAIAIVGSRSLKDYKVVEEHLNQHASLLASFVGIISGGSIGTDTLVERYAHEHDIPIIVCHPNYKRYEHKKACWLRSRYIISQASHLVAFWDGHSHGTRNTIVLARRRGIAMTIINVG